MALGNESEGKNQIEVQDSSVPSTSRSADESLRVKDHEPTSGCNDSSHEILSVNGSNTAQQENPNFHKQKRSCCKRLLNLVTNNYGPSVICPTFVWPLKVLALVIAALIFWASAYTISSSSEILPPKGNLFTLVMLFILAYVVGQMVTLIRLPPLLGMLLTGIALRNLGFFNLTGVYLQIVPRLRTVAMIVILTKAGLGLDAGALKKLSFVVLRLAFAPCVTEAVTVAVVAHFLLGFSWLWGFLLGFVLGAVSPAVVVPSLLSLKEKGYGEDKGISTLVIAASSIDDIAAISCFGVVLGSIFSTGNLSQQLMQGPLEVIIGLSFGVIWGLVASYIPHPQDPWVIPVRAFIVAGGGVFSVFGSQLINFSGAGPLACITSAFVACSCWKKMGWSSVYNPVEKIFSVIWLIFQPILFGLIGTEINLRVLDQDTVIYGISVLIVGLVVRICICFLATLGGTLNLKEQLFVAIAWLPKATVQAALGPVALDIAKHQPEVVVSNVMCAEKVLTIAVLSILLTAPLGAVGIYVSGPKLLYRKRCREKTDTDVEQKSAHETEPLNTSGV